MTTDNITISRAVLDTITLALENAQNLAPCPLYLEALTEALAAGKQALEQTQGEACKYADMCNEEGECTSGCSDRKNAQPVAYVVFASNGNIRICGHAPDDVTRIKAEFGSSLIPLYTNPQASEPASPSDAELLDFIEEHPHLALRKHKNRWSFVGLTNYEYPTFETAREAIKAALVASTY